MIGVWEALRRFSDVGSIGTVMLLAIGLSAKPAAAEIRVGVIPPVAIRGCDLVVPLVSDDGGDRWPATLAVQVGSRTVEATIAWIVPRPVEQPRWTTPATPVAIVEAPDRGPRPVGNPIAVIPLPADGDGELELLGTSWTPVWWRSNAPFSSEAAVAASLGSEADPPLDDPMAWFRWALRADLEGGQPPVPVDMEPIARRVAVAIASEWRSGLARVASASPGAAREIAERLVATVTDDRRPLGDRLVAAWPTDPRALSGLRAILLDPARTPMEAAQAGLSWFDARPPFVAWVLEPGGDVVTLEIANPTSGEVVALASWTDSGQSTALVLPPRSLTRHRLDRPRYQSGPSPPFEEVQLEAGGRVQRLLLGPRAIPVRPPGGDFGTLGLPRTLAAMEGDFVEAPPPAASTTALLRHRDGRWEIFIEARSPGRPADDDRFVLRFGEGDRPVAVLEVRADGRRRVEQGVDDGSLVVRTHRTDGLWRAEVVPPEQWLVDAIGRVRGGAVMIGLRRHGPGGFITFAGPPPPAWRREMPVLAFALGDWGRPPASSESTDDSSTTP
ncbi:MAG: hypothetical protein RLZZ461_1420 [Planctomycetota bacterium]|jgi:hypothetical protein